MKTEIERLTEYRKGDIESICEATEQAIVDGLGFDLVGYGCTTCIGNSGPLAEPVAQAIIDGGLAVAAVLSGNRNFEGRVHPQTKLNYLASPPLEVAYALAGPAVLHFSTRTLSAPLIPGADGVEIVPQWSTDLVHWDENRFHYLGGEPRQWRIHTPPFGEPRLFFRLKVKER